MPLLTHAWNWYSRFERPISSLSLIAGFIFDAFTLRRVDFLFENIWIVGRLAAVAVCIILINLNENEARYENNPSKAHFWYVNILQFFFGGLLGTFLVFYFRSSTLAVTWPFLLLLAAALFANERLKQHYTRLVFQTSLFFLSLFAFAIFIVPVLFHRIGADIFLISGLASIAILWLFIRGLGFFARERFKKSRDALTLSVSGIFLAVNALYFLNLIPPIPLSLKDGGVYHSVVRNAAGNYVVQREIAWWPDFLSLKQNVHMTEGGPLYAYSAIFSPTFFNIDIVHDWQKYDGPAKQWVTESRVALRVTGGRDGGYRTYSIKRTITAGAWRVNVETAAGQIIGRLRFEVTLADTEPVLETDIKK